MLVAAHVAAAPHISHIGIDVSIYVVIEGIATTIALTSSIYTAAVDIAAAITIAAGIAIASVIAIVDAAVAIAIVGCIFL